MRTSPLQEDPCPSRPLLPLAPEEKGTPASAKGSPGEPLPGARVGLRRSWGHISLLLRGLADLRGLEGGLGWPGGAQPAPPRHAWRPGDAGGEGGCTAHPWGRGGRRRREEEGLREPWSPDQHVAPSPAAQGTPTAVQAWEKLTRLAWRVQDGASPTRSLLPTGRGDLKRESGTPELLSGDTPEGHLPLHEAPESCSPLGRRAEGPAGCGGARL